MNLIIRFITILLVLSYSGIIHAGATATVNRDSLSADETLTLIISSDTPKDVDKLNLQPVEVDFEVLNTSESSQFSMINGTTKSSKTWQITLAPKRSGQLRIPGLDIGTDRTNSIGITVTKSVPMSQRAGTDNIFMEAELNLERAWVQQEVVYTTRIFFYPGLNRGADLADLDIPNTIVTQLSEANYQRTIKGKNYNVYEIKYALFPQSSGTLKIPGQIFTGSLSDPRRSNSFFGYGSGGKSVRIRNVDQEILIEPRPAGFVGKQWLPARNIRLREEWSENPNGMQVGQPVTRSIVIEADGLQASQLPPLAISAPLSAQIYPDEAVNNEVADSKGVRSTRTENLALIPSEQGNLTLPEVSLNWWNTTTQKMETATIAERTFAVLGGNNASRQPAISEAQPEQQLSDIQNGSFDDSTASSGSFTPSTMWRNFFFGVLALWLLTLIAYFRKRTPQAEATAKDNSTAIIETEASSFAACRQVLNEPRKLRQALIVWGKQRWPLQPINSNTDIANLSQSSVIKAQLTALDRAVYNKSDQGVAAFNGQELLDELEKLRLNSDSNTTQNSTKLAPLFQSDR